MSEVREYKCPCCGGAIEFNSSIQKMKCPFCDTEFEIEAAKAYNEDLEKDSNSDMAWDDNVGGEWQEGEEEGMRIYSCNSCGGEIIVEETTAASNCPYCDNPVVMTGQFKGNLKPDYVIPFKFDKKQAKEALKKHMTGKRLLPKVFKDENHIEEIKGVYVPFWLFDADVDADMRYRGTKVRSWSSKDYNYVETSFYSIVRNGNLGFNLIPVDGSSKMPDDLMESIEPFEFKDAVDFNTAYLSGYLADKYDVDSNVSIKRANERIKKSTEDTFRRTVSGYNTVTCENSSINIKDGKIKYALYPVWILTTKWKDEKYIFAMNGQTGKFVGNMPTDWKTYWKYFFILTFGIGIIIYAIMWLYILI